ncbi:UNVERIFIED_ORG: Icc-related predicted phosphoesterase [Rhizobium esperanzae]
MKIWIFSDLHLEMGGSRDLDVPAADLCLCAGDILDRGPAASIRFLGEVVAPFMPVILVPGNHEYYRSSLVEGFAAGVEQAMKYDRVTILDGGAVDINGIHVVGATLWTDFALFGDDRLAMFDASQALNDYRKIKLSKQPFRRFTTHEARDRHFRARAAIETCLTASSEFPTVVVTHHAPSVLSVSHEYLNDPLTASFASNLERLILRHQPRLWVHGHLHNPSDYYIGRTRVVCNPRGYPGEPQVRSFNTCLVIDVEAKADVNEEDRGGLLGPVLDH